MAQVICPSRTNNGCVAFVTAAMIKIVTFYQMDNNMKEAKFHGTI